MAKFHVMSEIPDNGYVYEFECARQLDSNTFMIVKHFSNARDAEKYAKDYDCVILHNVRVQGKIFKKWLTFLIKRDMIKTSKERKNKNMTLILVRENEEIHISPYGFEWYVDTELVREGLVEDFDETIEMLKDEGFEQVN